LGTAEWTGQGFVLRKAWTRETARHAIAPCADGAGRGARRRRHNCQRHDRPSVAPIAKIRRPAPQHGIEALRPAFAVAGICPMDHGCLEPAMFDISGTAADFFGFASASRSLPSGLPKAGPGGRPE
jgi:hypothetical protein